MIVYPSNMAPFAVKLCQNAFQTVPNILFFTSNFCCLRIVLSFPAFLLIFNFFSSALLCGRARCAGRVQLAVLLETMRYRRFFGKMTFLKFWGRFPSIKIIFLRKIAAAAGGCLIDFIGFNIIHDFFS